MSDQERDKGSKDFVSEDFAGRDFETKGESTSAPPETIENITELGQTGRDKPSIILQRILVAGSRKITESNYDQISQLVIMIGTRIMNVDNSILLNGGTLEGSERLTVDRLVCIGAKEQLGKSGSLEVEKERIITLIPEKANQQHYFRDIGKGEVDKGANPSLRRRHLVERADAIITIEGDAGTKEIIDYGKGLNKPVLPIASTGGASAKGWKDFEEYILQTFGIEKPSDEYKMLTTPKGLDSPSQLSDLVISMIKDKLKSTETKGDNGKDFLPLLQDVPTEEDRLARRPFAKHLAIRFRNIYSQDHEKGAFMLHIHGEWGSGKTSLLKLLADELGNGNAENAKERTLFNLRDIIRILSSIPLAISRRLNSLKKREKAKQGKNNNQKWIVVWFNAWEHERSGPPWWSLMNSVYTESLKQLPLFSRLKLRLRENSWRVRNGLSYRLLWPFVIVAGIIAILLISDTQAMIDATKTVDALINYVQNKVGLIIATSVAIVSGIFALSTSLAPGSARAARQFIDTVQDPTRRLSSHFEDLRDWIGYPIVVFIDDLDRCQHAYTVEILERIQTLFRKVDVIYVVAADRRWIYTSYNKAYDMFRKSMYESGRPLRFMFLEKIFQLSMNVPPVDSKVKEEFWKYLVSNKTLDPKELSNRLKDATKTEEEKFEKLHTEREVLAEYNMKTDDDPIRESAKRGAAIVRLASLELQKDIERRLAPFSSLVENNPRLMKRVVNAYTIALATEIGSGGENMENTGRIALQAILSLRWPRLTEYLDQHPNMINFIGNTTDNGKGFKTKIPYHLKSTMPKDICNLFEDSRVIDVVTGNAPNVNARLHPPTNILSASASSPS